MRELQGKKRTRSALYSWPVVAVLAFMVFLLARGAWGAWEKERYAERKAEESLRELAELEEREDELAGRVERLQTDRGKEEEIRKRYLVGKEGEGVIYITASASSSGERTAEEKSFLSPLFEWFR